MKRRKPGILILTLCVWILAGQTSLASPDIGDLLDHSNALEEQKKIKEEELEQYKEQYTILEGESAKLEEEMIETGSRITKTKEELDAAQKIADKQYNDMKLRIQYIFETGGEAGLLVTFLESKDFKSLVTNAEYVNTVYKYDREKLTEYENSCNKIQEIKEELEAQMKDLEAKQKEFQKKQEEMTALIQTISSEIENIGQEIQDTLGEIGALFGIEGGIADYTGEGSTEAATAIVSAAYSQLGVPYVWGGTSPGSALDCSGLTQFAHGEAGISIPRTSGAQLSAGQLVAEPMPGDIAWTPGHVGIYIGNGQMIEAPQPGSYVTISAVRAVVYVRYW